MRISLCPLISLTFSIFFFPYNTYALSFGEKLLMKWEMINFRLLENLHEEGAPRLYYVDDYCLNASSFTVEICNNGTDDDGDGLIDCEDPDCSFQIYKELDRVSCPANQDGAINVTVIGGTPPYLYDWDNDGTGDNDDAEDLTGLSTGTYGLTVTDANACTTSLNVVMSFVNDHPYSAMIITGADSTPFPTSSNGNDYYLQFPTGADSFDFSFDHSFIPEGYSLDADWQGTGTMHYVMNDGNPSSNAYQFVGERVTEYSDFNPGDIPNQSGNVYDVYGRGHFTYNSGTNPGGHSWTVTYDFTTLINGFLPAGTLIGFTDIDGIALNGESVLLSATVPSGSGANWLATPPFDLGYNPPEFPHSQAVYNTSTKSYLFNGPSATNTTIAYLTAKDLTSISMELTHGSSGGSYGMKFAAPIYPDTVEVNTTNATCNANNGTITLTAEGATLEYSINGGLTYQLSPFFNNLAAGNYQLVVRDFDTKCERIINGNPVAVSLTPCQEICDNGLDDDFDGLIDCDDPDCSWVSISNIVVSDCIDHPLADVATVEMDIDWGFAPAGEMIVVSIAGKKEYIPVDFLAPPQLVTFNVPADGSQNNLITVSWQVNQDLCQATDIYDAPENCSSDGLPCNILFISGNYLPGDGNAWDAGWLQYLDGLNGTSTIQQVLAKPDATGLGLYDPAVPSNPATVVFENFDLIIISASTQQQVSNGLIAALKDLPQVILVSNYSLLNDFGMTTNEGFYLVQDHAFLDNTTQRTLYSFNNLSPTNSKVVSHGDYNSNATVDLWGTVNGYNSGTEGVMFGFDELDNLPGIASIHGKRVFLGYSMEGIYSNAENGGALPVPTESYFDPIKHLSLVGKYYLDFALINATSNCSGVENCYNDVDDDGDGLSDCKDPDCTPIPIQAVSAQYRTINIGLWTNTNTWQGGNIPPVGSLTNVTISIEHDVTLNSGNITLLSGAKLWVTNSKLTLKGGGLTINGSSAIFNNASLVTWSGYDVELKGNKPRLTMTNSAADIGGKFENSSGNRTLRSVCLTVDEEYINASKDSLIDVCASIAVNAGGFYRNSFFAQTYVLNSEIKVANGDFANYLLASVSGSNLKLWVQNGAVSNSGFWTAGVAHHCVSGSNGIPSYLLFQPEACSNISWYFDNCDCDCSPSDEICTSGIDEDGDGIFDCEDPDCSGVVEAGPNAQSCSGEDVSLSASILVGNGPYTFTWSHGLGSSSSVVVSPTETTLYSVTISNGSGCSAQDSVMVTIGTCAEICTNGLDDDGDGLIDCNDPDCRLTIIGSPQSPICLGGQDGWINATTTGGKVPYSFNWSTGANTEDISGLAAGSYQVTATDSYGCSATALFNVADGYEINVSAEISHSNCYGDANGSINLDVSGGTSPYSFAWTNGATTEDISGLTAGVYGVTVSDANSCSTTGFYTVLHAQNAAYEIYFVPMPEEDIRKSFKKFTDYYNKSISSSIRTIISMVATEDGTLLYYDHWEDGYEVDIFNPTQSTTELWGDNQTTNGMPPGFSSDLLNTGDVIGMDNEVPIPRNPTQIRYDGKDKIVVSHQLALSRAAWAPTPGPVLSGAVDIMDVNAFGKEFEVPIGEDIASDEMFEYTSAFVMAQSNTTFVYFDSDGNGVTDFTEVLNEGETFQVDGGIDVGYRITSSKPVQVHLVTGDLGGLYENRWFTLFPKEKWDNSYFAPVGTTVNSDPAHVFLYNPNNSSITVNYATKSGTGTFNISSKNVYRFAMPMHSGAHFYTNNQSDSFYAVSTIDSDADDHDAHDWGYNLVPESYLTVSATLGWGPGNADLSGNGSPAWVIASQPTKLYVDYDGDPSTGPKTDPNGNRYDVDYNLTAYESKRVFDNNDNDQTGMYLYTLDGALISAAWGQDPLTAAPGNPYLDFGTTVPPIRKVHSWKTYEHTVDNNGDGLVDPGDEITFYLNIENSGNTPVLGLTILDQLPDEVTYIPNTTYFNNNLVNDNSSGTPFPVDEIGYSIASVPINTAYVISFRTEVNAQPPVFDKIINQFTTLVSLPCKTMIGEVVIPVVPYTSTTDNCSLIFTDEDGFSVSTYLENSVVCVHVEDDDLNESQSLVDFYEVTIYNDNFDDRETFNIIETGANTGVFEGCIVSSSSEGGLVEDGILFAQGNHNISTTFNDPQYGEQCADQAGFILSTETKPLYFSGPGLGLDRIDPVAVHDQTTAVVGLGNEATVNCTVADGFNSSSYANNDGTENWSANWNEIGESDNPNSGSIRIYSNKLRLFTENEYPWIYRSVDLSNASDVSLSFDVSSSGSNLESNDYIKIEISSDGGGSWTLLQQYNDQVNTSKTIDISSYATANTRIRFKVDVSYPNNEYYAIDNLEISYLCSDPLDNTVTFVQSTPMCTDLEMPAGGVLQVTAYATGQSFTGTSTTIYSRIKSYSDDAEQEGPDGDYGGNGYMYHGSSDIELVGDYESPPTGTQKIGLRFTDLDIPQGASITNAFLTFNAVSADSPMNNYGSTNLNIRCEDANSPGTFTNSYFNISNRTLTSASTAWSPGSWSTGYDYDSPDLSTVVQEVVDRPGWSGGNSMVFVITGTGHRSARSRESSSTYCPRLTVEYTTGAGADVPENPNITAVLKHGTTTFATLTNPVYNSAEQTMIWSSVLSSGHTLPAGEKVSLEITQNETGYSFDIEFDSETKPSKIDLPTKTVIKVEELAVYDAAYPNGIQKAGAENGETVYIRTTVSDPFGPDDITSLDITILSPSGLIMIDTTLISEGVADEFGCNKVYEMPWVTGVEQGTYNIHVVAHEGYEGIKDEASTTIEIQHADLGSPCQVYFSEGQNIINSYDPNATICANVIDGDENKNPALAETVAATISNSSGDLEAVTLTETGLNTGIFQYCLPSSSSVVGTNNNGTLYAPAGSIITLVFVDPDIDIDECSTSVPVNSLYPNVDISIKQVKPADGVALVGEAIQFDITITNTGPSALTYLYLENSYNDSKLTYTGSSLPPDGMSPSDLEWDINAVIEPGQGFTIETYYTGAAPSNSAVSTASVSGNDEFSQAVSAGPVQDDVIITDPKVSIDKYVTAPIAPFYLEGDTITYQIDITNTGTTDISVLPLADVYSTSCLQFVDAVPAADGAGGGVIVWGDLGALSKTATTSVTARFVVTGDCNPVNNTTKVSYAIDVNGDLVPPAQDVEPIIVETPPVAIDDFDSTSVATPVIINVPLNDYDLNGNLNIGSVVSVPGLLQAGHGSISINTTIGLITYTPVSSYSGIDQFEYIICDSTALCDTALVTITIINEDCSNGIDDDGDGFIDCNDPDCTNFNNGGLIGGNEAKCGEYDPLKIVSLSLPSGGAGGGYIYKWQYSPNGGLSWLDIPGAFGVDYDPPVINQTMFFRRGARRFICATWKYSNFVTKTVTTCPEICNNGLDDDEDGLTDCEDDDCAPTVYASSNLSICLGSSTTITASASGGVSPYIYTWDNGLGIGESHEVTPAVTTTYRVMVMSASGCVAFDSLTVSVVTCPEDCTDGTDNDGDGLIDCDDPDCQEIGQPRPIWDEYLTCPGQEFIEQVIFNDENLHNPSFSIYTAPEKGSVTINYQGIFVYSPNGYSCGRDSFVYEVCNQTTGCCDTASVFLNIGDQLPPDIQNVPADITIGCDESIPPIPNLVYAIDACPGIYISYSQTSTQQAGNTCKTYTITRKWEATDLCGNKASKSQVITVEDVLDPEIFRVYTLSNGKRVAGGVAKRTTTQWRYIEFPISFGSVPLVFTQVTTEQDPSAVAVRIRNVSKQGFEMKLQEEEDADNVHGIEDVSWMAFQPGNLSDGSLEADKVLNVNSALYSLNFQNTYSGNPAFIGNVQTYNEADPISIRYRNLDPNSIDLSLQEEKSFDTESIHANEDMGYIACEPGNLTDEIGILMGEAGSLSLQHNWVTVNLANSYNKPIVILGGLTIAGSHPSLLRVRNVTSNSFEVRIQEWDYLDGWHAVENISYIVLEGSIPASSDFYCGQDALPLVIGENLFATDNCDDQLLFSSIDSTSFDQYGMKITRSWTAIDDCGNETTISRVDTCARAAVKLKAILNGATLSSNPALMKDDLRTKDLIPLTEPYSGFGGLTHYGDGGDETTTQGIMDIVGEDAIVDWVFVELRSKNDPREILSTKSALIESDGDIISADGDTILFFPQMLEDDYFVCLRHRNHLPIMTDDKYYLATSAVPFIDMTSNTINIYGGATSRKDIGSNLKALWVGDMNKDQKVIYQGPDNDVFTLFSLVLSQSGNTSHLANYIVNGYYKEDVNLDGRAIYQGPNNDRAIVLYQTLLPHPLNSSNLANFIVQAALP